MFLFLFFYIILPLLSSYRWRVTLDVDPPREELCLRHGLLLIYLGMGHSEAVHLLECCPVNHAPPCPASARVSLFKLSQGLHALLHMVKTGSQGAFLIRFFGLLSHGISKSVMVCAELAAS